MPDQKNKFHGAEQTSQRGQPLPRRNSPDHSVTLRHHRLARDASIRGSSASAAVVVAADGRASLPRSNSSESKGDTAHSDPSKWFNRSNYNASGAIVANAIDVDPPFFQKITSPSEGDNKRYYCIIPDLAQVSPQKPAPPTHSSSADDYRSVIDDLTIEIQRLKEELKQYKQSGPDALRGDKLFEIKVHGLPQRKKRELEAKLRDFAAGLERTPSAETMSQRKKTSRHSHQLYSSAASMSKPAASSAGSHSRPADSAYASMSIGPHSSGVSLGRPTMNSRARSSEQKVESYLNDIPEGLYPRHMVMTEKEKKKLVVRRLERLFTGQAGGRNRPGGQGSPHAGTSAATPIRVNNASEPGYIPLTLPPTSPPPEASREARILGPGSSTRNKKSGSRDNMSVSNSSGEQAESAGNAAADGFSAPNASPSTGTPPEQRPTRPRDLDPDRVQIPSENIEYIRHLGIAPPDALSKTLMPQDVSPDEEGWVYLNILCNLAQLHMLSVTPAFIRLAVSEKSAKFQLSSDGRKIRWRGGVDGTKFSSDSSGENSPASRAVDAIRGSNPEGKRNRLHAKIMSGVGSGRSDKNILVPGVQHSESSGSFQYRPLFFRRSSSNEHTSLGDTGSSHEQLDESNTGGSKWGLSGSGSSLRRKRQWDGTIIYYNGVPFCTDLSGDSGDISPATHTFSSSQEQQADRTIDAPRPTAQRTISGSLLLFRPFSAPVGDQGRMDVDSASSPPGMAQDSSGTSSDLDFDFPWVQSQQHLEVKVLEACGLGGVVPDDHFMVVVSTKRPKIDLADSPGSPPSLNRCRDTPDAIVERLATLRASSPTPQARPTPPRVRDLVVQVEYLAGKIRRLPPVSLPPPVTFIPPFSSDDSSEPNDDIGSEEDEEMLSSAVGPLSRRLHSHEPRNEYPDDADITSADEQGEESDNDAPPISTRLTKQRTIPSSTGMVWQRNANRDQNAGSSFGASADGTREIDETGPPESSAPTAATAGGAESGYNSSREG